MINFGSSNNILNLGSRSASETSKSNNVQPAFLNQSQNFKVDKKQQDTKSKKEFSSFLENEEKPVISNKNNIAAQSTKPHVPGSVLEPDTSVNEVDLTDKVNARFNGTRASDESTPAEVKVVKSSDEPIRTYENEAIMRFFYAMQAQLGISPEKIVAAMATLNTDELLQSPEQTMQNVLNNLNLSGSKREIAANLYQNMLYESAQQGMRSQLNENNQSAELALLTPKQARQIDSARRVDNMSDQFFMRREEMAVPTTNTGIAKQLSSDANQFANLQVREQKPEEQKLAEQNTFTNNLPISTFPNESVEQGFDTSSVSAQNQSAAPNASTAKPVNKSFNMPDSSEAQLKIQDAANSFDPKFGLKKMEFNPAVLATDANLSAAGSLNQTQVGTTQAQPEQQLRDLLQTLMGSQGHDEHSSDQTGDDDSGFYQNDQLSTLIQPTTSGSKFFAPEVRMTEAQQAVNLRQVVQQSQVLIDKGGGEMKMQLTPEGMGQVQLKVKLDQGQVKIELVADNVETKKLLENGINDLRANLHGHKLNVDSIRVDMSQPTGKEWSGFTSDQSQQQARDQAQSFMQNFRQDRQEYLQGFMGGGVPRGYREQKREPLQPVTTQGRDSNRRLDLVA